MCVYVAVATSLSKSRLLFTLTWTGAYMCTISVYNRTLGRVAAINTTFTLPPVSLLRELLPPFPQQPHNKLTQEMDYNNFCRLMLLTAVTCDMCVMCSCA